MLDILAKVTFYIKKYLLTIIGLLFFNIGLFK
jgi:hypothetical protein